VYKNDVIPSASVVLRFAVGSSSHGMTGVELQITMNMNKDVMKAKWLKGKLPTVCVVKSIKDRTKVVVKK